MGSAFAKNSEYHWVYSDEPHATRRREILKKYPQIKELYGYDPNTKWVMMLYAAVQYLMAMYIVPQLSWFSVVLLAYSLGGIMAHALFLGLHETSHNLLFQKPLHNKIFGVLINTSTIVPHFTMFQRYHMEHHLYQGVEGIDVDVPVPLEGVLFTNAVTKVLWVLLMPLFYVIRPFFIKAKEPGMWEAISWTVSITFAAVVFAVFGVKAVTYLFISGILGAGLHPLAGHFISEHWEFINNQETYSYYGIMNSLTFNVGYHNEHHDFPRIPGSRLPEVRRIASEYYDPLPSHGSWAYVLWQYISTSNVGPLTRVKRGGKRSAKITLD